jgi:hypothetical protein
VKSTRIMEIILPFYLPLMGPRLARDRAAHAAAPLEQRDPADGSPTSIILSTMISARDKPHIWKQGEGVPLAFSDDAAGFQAHEATLALVRAGWVDERVLDGVSRNMAAYEVMAKRCDQCLYSDAKIVPDDSKAAIIESCVDKGHHFTCHKATLQGWDVACRGFHEAHPGNSAASRMAAALGIVVPVTEAQLVARARAKLVIEWKPARGEAAAEAQEMLEHELRREGRSAALEARIAKRGGRIVQK